MTKEKELEKKLDNKKITKRKLNGIVVSDKMDKTIVVRVDKVKQHPKYKKRYAASKKYKVHDEKNQFKEGDKVIFVECRPLSKDKKWRVLYAK
ncbi:30S ribosomal protein S17 [Candidatus Falkowbacteria bacterium CG11_big_fil_rev_8_21_14_0_20_39_10]|uniref:Small ribosomal subunit protein uS17 n=1 Tax=Candidatus Falkowbacteria bacterium CG11_big_fil_rev_8_21_14_0_20_39_10 TaxID=1974570 RepID=A0A2M6K982_9BACT|nr:MAG: 30S ribosomal protein S17 [Candidatus Falkowbacteria bacterium CG11_big_fil_rev_8_21_14_0_20_39_10]